MAAHAHPHETPKSPSIKDAAADPAAERLPRPRALIDARIMRLNALSVLIGAAGAFLAKGLMALINLITNLAFYGRWSFLFASPADHHLGGWVLVVPAIGGLIVGMMARYGSEAIRGHGIPEAMEHILMKESRIAPRVTLLKPLSAAIAIGTGGPFGAEGPIIATGGALGSLIGQILKITPDERRTLLAAGSAAGMAATFGCPLAAVLLSIELLLFEFSARSLIPVAIASAVAAGTRGFLFGFRPMFEMPALAPASLSALLVYLALGVVVGVASVGVTKAVFLVEDFFKKLPIHWMWWPALGAIAVGAVALIEPRTLGVGYDNIDRILSGSMVGRSLLGLGTLKFVSWAASLGTGTSGGTLAPLFTIGGALGGWLGAVAARIIPHAGIDPRMAALVGMAALFAGASRAFLASVAFAFETTFASAAVLPLLGGCAAAHLMSCWLMRYSIMTGKIARDGAHVPAEYEPDVLTRVRAEDVGKRKVVVLRASDPAGRAGASILASKLPHQGFPVVGDDGRLVGVLTRRDLESLDPKDPRPLGELIRRSPVTIFEDDSLHAAVELMLLHGIGRLPIVPRAEPWKVTGMLTRSDVLSAYEIHFDRRRRVQQHIRFW